MLKKHRNVDKLAHLVQERSSWTITIVVILFTVRTNCFESSIAESNVTNTRNFDCRFTKCLFSLATTKMQIRKHLNSNEKCLSGMHMLFLSSISWNTCKMIHARVHFVLMMSWSIHSFWMAAFTFRPWLREMRAEGCIIAVVCCFVFEYLYIFCHTGMWILCTFRSSSFIRYFAQSPRNFCNEFAYSGLKDLWVGCSKPTE